MFGFKGRRQVQTPKIYSFLHLCKRRPRLQRKDVASKIFNMDVNGYRKYRVIINDCLIAVGVENLHKFGMCR
jgi:hypothetical protein